MAKKRLRWYANGKVFKTRKEALDYHRKSKAGCAIIIRRCKYRIVSSQRGYQWWYSILVVYFPNVNARGVRK